MECLSPELWFEPSFYLWSFSLHSLISATFLHGLKIISSLVKDILLKNTHGVCEDVMYCSIKRMTQTLFEQRPVCLLSFGWLCGEDLKKKPVIRKLSAAVLWKSEPLKTVAIPVVFRWLSKQIWQSLLEAKRSSDFQKQNKQANKKYKGEKKTKQDVK